jgi:hypothetical protein
MAQAVVVVVDTGLWEMYKQSTLVALPLTLVVLVEQLLLEI